MTHKKTMINTLLVAALFGGVNVAQAADVPALVFISGIKW